MEVVGGRGAKKEERRGREGGSEVGTGCLDAGDARGGAVAQLAPSRVLTWVSPGHIPHLCARQPSTMTPHAGRGLSWAGV